MRFDPATTLFITDLDGTLLDGDKQISQENRDAIAKLTQQDIFFVPASGRAWTEMPRAIRENPDIRYYITSDGTQIYDKLDGEIIWEKKISKETGKWILEELYKHDVCLMLHDDTRSYTDNALDNDDTYTRLNMNQIWIDHVRGTNEFVDNYKEFVYGLGGYLMVCAFFADPAALAECKAKFSSHSELEVVQSDPNNLEVYCRQGGKGRAMRELAGILGFPYKQTIAVGDSTNDSNMIKLSGLGLAMENAVPELKELADFVICNNDEHAINYILEHYI